MHWFLVGKSAHVPFNKISVEAGAKPILDKHLKDILRKNKENYIGGTEELRIVIDDYTNQSKKRASCPATVTPEKETSPKRTARPTLPTARNGNDTAAKGE